MNTPTFVFADNEANALGRHVIDGLYNLPPISSAVPADIAERPIWEEMYSAGLISGKQCQEFTADIGPNLGDFLAKQVHGRPLRSLRARLALVPGVGDLLATNIGNFIRARYGFDPSSLPHESKWTFERDGHDIDVASLDSRLSNALTMPLGQGELALSDSARNRLVQHAICLLYTSPSPRD